MAYLHQLPLISAVKKLYMLGKSDRKPTRGPGDELGENIGSLIARDMSSKPKPQPTKNDSGIPYYEEMSPDEKQWRSDMYNRGTYLQQGMQLHQPVNFEEALAREQANKIAEASQIAGRYTEPGLQQADKEATANAQDRIVLKGIMGTNIGRGSF